MSVCPCCGSPAPVLPPFIFTEDEEMIYYVGQYIHMAPRERMVLKFLCENANKFVSTEQLLSAVYGDELKRPPSNVIKVYVSKIRRCFRERNIPYRIQMVPRVGYKIILSPRDVFI